MMSEGNNKKKKSKKKLLCFFTLLFRSLIFGVKEKNSEVDHERIQSNFKRLSSLWIQS